MEAILLAVGTQSNRFQALGKVLGMETQTPPTVLYYDYHEATQDL